MLLALRDAAFALDPVRLQKGMFLLAQEGGLPAGERYEFRPYDYGPFSSEIYSDLDELVAAGLVEGEEAPGYTWHRYRATPQGVEVAGALAQAMRPEDQRTLEFLHDLKRDVLSQGFRELLHHVYSRHPGFASRSIFTG